MPAAVEQGVATAVVHESAAEAGKHDLDQKYESLNTKIREVDKKSKEFKMIEKYVASTHGTTHTQYKLSITDLFAVEREGETKAFEDGGFGTDPNRQLLWHGSRICNWAGILCNGLRIAPKEAVASGYMFGKGL